MLVRFLPFTAVLAAISYLPAPVWSAETDSVARGKYIFDVGGCAACHTDRKNKGKLAAGGGALRTKFGIFYGPNITPDPDHGIGKWSDADFITALRQGVSPMGEHYFPVFPYTSFTKITDQDLRDLKSYIFSLPPVAMPSRPHDVKFPFGFRNLLPVWKSLFFKPGAFTPDPAKGAQWNRGAYLARALAHCGECHSPRNLLGGIDAKMELAGNSRRPEGGTAPNITQDKFTGIGAWTKRDMFRLLKQGLVPSGEFVGETMADVAMDATGKMTRSDIEAMTEFLFSLPPIENDPNPKK